jgi:hypothetical protein
VAPVLIPAVLLLAAWQWARGRGTHITYVILGILAASIAAHWLAFRYFHLLLPKQRTGIWIVPLIMLAAGSVATGRRGLTIALYSLSIYFLLCLRLDHFREWRWEADVNKVYDVVAYYNHTYGVKRIGCSWRYSAALNYYRVASGRESLDEISGGPPIPAGRPLYVLNSIFEDDMIQRLQLHVVYRGERTEVVVAVGPEMEAAQRTASCGVH